MTEHRFREAIAAEKLEPGDFVRIDEHGRAARDPTLRGPGGLVRRERGGRNYRKGAKLSVRTDGAALARVTAPVEIRVGRRNLRLPADEHQYLRLAAGRVVGVLGDHLTS